MLIAQNLTYSHSNHDLLFDKLSFTIHKNDKIALIGNNGTGKSTLLKILGGILAPKSGSVECQTLPYYIPQHFGQYNELSIAQAIHVDSKLESLYQILNGKMSENSLNLLDDDWDIENRIQEALSIWGLQDLDTSSKLGNLSGGEKTKVFLAGISIHKPDIILLDEPTNHLDNKGRDKLNEFIQDVSCTMVVVSHDRTLLQLLDSVYELEKGRIRIYGGNYSFYKTQKKIEDLALSHKLDSLESNLRNAKQVERIALQRKNKQDTRGKAKQQKSGIARILIKSVKNSAENSSKKLKTIHSEKISRISNALSITREKIVSQQMLKLDIEDSILHPGKVLFSAKDINYVYKNHPIWKKAFSFQINSGERIHIEGANGSGKTTLLKIILGLIEVTDGTILKSYSNSIYIDQEYGIVNNDLSVFEQVELFNCGHLEEHEIKIRLNRFLFPKDFWAKPCKALSGGEKMRLALCGMMISNHAPDIFILDEPTNNLDIRNIEILTQAVCNYQGTLIVVSHDKCFLKEIGILSSICMDGYI